MSDDVEHRIGLVTGTAYDADGHLGFQTDTFGGKGAGCPSGEYQTPFGFLCRPLDPALDADGDPIPDQSAQASHAWHGSELHGFPTQDPRITPKLPQLTKGSSCNYSSTGAYVLQDAATGDTTIYVPFGGKAHVIALSASGDHVTVRHADGAGVALTADACTLNGPDATSFIQLLSGGKAVVSGNLSVAGAAVLGLGPTGVPPAPLAHGAPIVTALSAIVTAMTAINAYAVAIKGTADPSNAATPTLTAAIGVLGTAIASANALIPALMVSGA